MEAKGSTFLKVTGILMIVFGAIALIVSIIAILGIDELGDEDWQFGEMSLSDFSGDYNSDLRLTLFHEDMSESYIVWEWEKDAGYLYRPSDSYFRESRVVDEPPADDILTEQT